MFRYGYGRVEMVADAIDRPEDYELQLSDLGPRTGKTRIFNLLVPGDLTNLIFFVHV